MESSRRHRRKKPTGQGLSERDFRGRRCTQLHVGVVIATSTACGEPCALPGSPPGPFTPRSSCVNVTKRSQGRGLTEMEVTWDISTGNHWRPLFLGRGERILEGCFIPTLLAWTKKCSPPFSRLWNR